MEIAIMLLGFGTVYFLTIAVYKVIYKDKIILTTRLETLAVRETGALTIDEKLNKPFVERVIRPLLEKLARQSARFMPAEKKSELQKKLLMAGNPGSLSPNEFLLIKSGSAIGLPVLAAVLMLPGGAPLNKVILAAAVGFMAGLLIPDYYLKIRAKSRKEEIQKGLPDVLDLLTVSVEAGLGFDAALVKVIEKVKGHLAEEFNRVLQEIKMGKPRRDALRDLGQRSGVDDLITFVGAIIQADQLGVSIGNVLRLQSEQMRQKRRQAAEEKAMKAPVKMLIPLILFIFPTIFIVLLGPAVIDIVQTMGK